MNFLNQSIQESKVAQETLSFIGTIRLVWTKFSSRNATLPYSMKSWKNRSPQAKQCQVHRAILLRRMGMRTQWMKMTSLWIRRTLRSSSSVMLSSTLTRCRHCLHLPLMARFSWYTTPSRCLSSTQEYFPHLPKSRLTSTWTRRGKITKYMSTSWTKSGRGSTRSFSSTALGASNLNSATQLNYSE